MGNLIGEGLDVRNDHHMGEYRCNTGKHRCNNIQHLCDIKEIIPYIKRDRPNSRKVSDLF